MSARRYVSKPVEIEAWRFDGSDNAEKVAAWCGGRINTTNPIALYIDTLEGEMRADVGDYIIRGTEGEHYPCKPSVFERKYEEVA